MIAAIFYIFGLLAIIFSLLVILLRNPMHSALALLGMFFSVAVIFILLGAEFVAIVQLFVYAGGILALYLFIIMFVDLSKEELSYRLFHQQKWITIILAIIINVFILLKVVPDLVFKQVKESYEGMLGNNPLVVARELFSNYIVPFEVASIILIVGMIGAVILAKPKIKQ